MNQIDRNNLLKAFLIILAIFLFVGGATFLHKKNSMTLDEYARLQAGNSDPSKNIAGVSGNDISGNTVSGNDASSNDVSSNSVTGDTAAGSSVSGNSITGNSVSGNSLAGNAVSDGNAQEHETALPGALLNGGPDGQAMLAERVTYASASGVEEAFYFEPLSDNLQRYITGISYPAADTGSVNDLAITYTDLRYVHILHYDFAGKITEGELICNAAIAPDLLDIFYELYRNEYQLEKVRLIDEYDGDDTASMEDNNTSCFNYRPVDGTSTLSKHALGLALDINPFYNPYVTYPNGKMRVSPAEALEYADRSAEFPYKIDENDLCYELFTKHGFTWGGKWNNMKDYQHFQKKL